MANAYIGLTRRRRNGLIFIVCATLILVTGCDSFQTIYVTNESTATVHVLSATAADNFTVPELGSRYTNTNWDVANLEPGDTQEFSAWSIGDKSVLDRDQVFVTIDPVSRRSTSIFYISYEDLKRNKWRVVIK